MLLENKREFVTLTICHDDLLEVAHHMLCTFVHQFDSSHVVGLFEVEILAELCKCTTIYAHYNVAAWQ